MKHIRIKLRPVEQPREEEKLTRVEGIIIDTAAGASMMDEVNSFLASIPRNSLVDLQLVPQIVGQMLAVISYEVCA